MANLKDLFKENLVEAVKCQVDVVKHQPDAFKERVCLFQLYCLNGSWKKALVHLKAAATLDGIALHMAQAYRETITCEVFRSEVFSGKRTPLVFGEPCDGIAELIESVGYWNSEPEKAKALRDKAFSLLPAVSGTINDERFSWIADADSRLGPVLEVIINGKYFWMPFSCIKTIQIEPPADLRDLVWLPVHFTFHNEGDVVGFIPTRYSGSEKSEDTSILLSAKTLWTETVLGEFFGEGQRVFSTDNLEVPLLEIRQLSLDPLIIEVCHQEQVD